MAIGTFAARADRAGASTSYARASIRRAARLTGLSAGRRRPSWPPIATVGLIAAIVLASARLHAPVRVSSGGDHVEFRAADRRRPCAQAVYDKLQRLSFRFFDANQSGSIINRVAGDVQAVRMFVDGVVIQFLTVRAVARRLSGLHVLAARAADAGLPGHDAAAVVRRDVVLHGHQAGLCPQQQADRSSRARRSRKTSRAFTSSRASAARSRRSRNSSPPIGRRANLKNWIFCRTSFFQPVIGFLTQLNMVVLLGYGGYPRDPRRAAARRRAVRVRQLACSSSPIRSAKSPTSPTAFRPA